MADDVTDGQALRRAAAAGTRTLERPRPGRAPARAAAGTTTGGPSHVPVERVRS